WRAGASPTAAGAPHRILGGRLSSRSSDRTTHPWTARAWGWASRSPAGSPTRWAGPSRPRRLPAAARHWSSPCRRRGERAVDCRDGRWRDVRAGPVTHVLVVDDERALLRALAMNLVARRYTVTEADSGTKALTAAASGDADVIVLDLGLPDISGLDVIRAVRGYSSTPIIVLSARTGSGDKVQALDLGADDYVTKPFSM